jgi:hypothetical protein
MSLARAPSWTELFADDATTGSPVLLQLRLLRRAGEPLLLVPTNPKFAAVALSLYPAQRTKARLIRESLRQIWRLGIPVNFETVAVSLVPDAPFPKFLAQGVATTPGAFPPLAILCGNPETAGRRFTILVFGPDRTPAAVVKAGVGEAAARLIDQEATFLKSAPRGMPAIPVLRSVFHGRNVHALAVNFAPGRTPAAEDYEGVGKLLTSWLDRGELRRLGDLPAWQALEGACRSHPLWEGVAGSLRNRPVRPAIFHGDFAPWNIKVASQDRSWTVLDWERGELVGIPGWDWFHYVFQYAILVSRLPLAGAVQRVHELFHHAAFERYSAAASIDGVQGGLFLAYLICYSTRFGSPKSGADLEELLKQLAGSWLKD